MSFQSLLTGNPSLNSTGASYIIGKVTKVILGPFLEDGKTLDPDYNDPTDIGKIRFLVFNSGQQFTVEAEGNPLASPMWPFFKSLPIEKEFVYIIPGPSVALNDRAGTQDYYYMPSFNLWRATNHNAFPDLAEYALLQGIDNSLTNEDKLRGVSFSKQKEALPISFGNDFVERSTRSLRPFVGDVILEGRWGNSIRFGSSLNANASENNWAVSTEDGDPIIIIRNGEGRVASTDPWVPVVEDINKDKSSIYLTSGQAIVIDDIQNNFSLASFDVQLKNSITQTKTLTKVPITTDNLSPQLVDKIQQQAIQSSSLYSGTSNINGEEQEPQSVTPTPSQGLVVLGDKYTSTGVSVVTLRAVSTSGEVTLAVTGSADRLQTAYVQAVNALKAEGLPNNVRIPLITQLQKI